MDAYQRYNTNSTAGPPPPPPPPSSEFQHDPLQQHPPPPPQTQWYPAQNHYQPTPPPPPPPPGSHHQYPPQPQQWGPQPTAYPNQHYPPQHQLPPPNRPPMHHPPPYHHSQVPSQSYSAGHQGWGNSNWTHHQGYEYQGQSNEDDWAARAKAWAAAKSAMDSQQQQSPFPLGIRTELPVPYQDQYVHVAEHQRFETKPGSYPVSYPHNSYGTENYQQASLPDGQSNNATGVHQYGPAGFNSNSSSGPDNHLAKDGVLVDESKATVRQQEVPNSYSSITGREVGANQNQMQFKSFPGPSNVLQGRREAPMVPAVDRPDSVDVSFSYHNQNGNVADMPLDFAPRANISTMYPPTDSIGHHRGMDSSATMPVNHSWTPHLTPGSVYPLGANSGSQFAPPISAHSPVPGLVAPVFGAIPGPNFQPTLPAVGGPFGPGHEFSTTFPVDPYGASSASGQPKKAAVPNWLKEEIYKKKAGMATSAHEYHKEETQSIEDEMGHQSFGKDDQTGSKGMDSSRSAEEEDDEDYVEAARTAAINKEIKRLLTEVLMKVTDDLFDEIATKVLSEEDITTEAAPNQSSPSVLVLDTCKGTVAKIDNGKTNPVLPGGLLGLVSYGTDSDEEDDEMNTGEKLSNEKHVKVDDDSKHIGRLNDTSNSGVTEVELINGAGVHEVVPGTNGDDRKQQNDSSNSDGKNTMRDKEQSNRDLTNEKPSLEMRNASDGKDSESKMSSRRSPVMEARDGVGKYRKEDQSRSKQEEKHPNKGKSDNRDALKDRKKAMLRTDEKLSRKRSSHYDGEDKKEIERSRRVAVHEDKKRELIDNEKSERSRHKHSSNSNRHKKDRSPSPRSRRKKNKADSSFSGGSSSSDESLDDSTRKSLSKRRPRSPSPVSSRKRQVSRSPEHSQRRHSPYYSLEGSRRKRSRTLSRSPRRHR